jgi:hypothetical protein
LRLIYTPSSRKDPAMNTSKRTGKTRVKGAGKKEVRHADDRILGAMLDAISDASSTTTDGRPLWNAREILDASLRIAAFVASTSERTSTPEKLCDFCDEAVATLHWLICDVQARRAVPGN